MRTPLLLTFLLAACASTPAPVTSEPQRSELPAEDLREVNDIFSRWEQAWRAHDMRAWAQLFHEDGTYVTWLGQVLVGRNAIENAMIEAHATAFRNSVQLSRPEEIRMVAPGSS